MLEQVVFFIIGISAILFFSLISYRIFRVVVNPVSIILWWWGGWLLVANCSVSGLFLPSWRTNLLISIFLLSYIFGCFKPAKFYKKSYKDSSSLIPNSLFIKKNNENYTRIKKLGKFFTVCLIVVVPFMVYYAYKSVNVIHSYGLGYRQFIIDSSYGGGIFQNKFIAYFFRVVGQSITCAYLFYGVSSFLFSRKYKFIFMSIVLTILQSAIYFSRSDIYLFLVVILVAYFTFDNSFISKNNNAVLKAKASLKKCFFLLFSILVVVSILRAGHRNIYELIKVYVIDYHTAGFVLLDQELSDSNSILHTQRTYGLSAVGGIERVAVTLLRLIDPDIHSIVFDNRAKHWAFILAGYTHGRELRYNALYNIVYGLYRDFGVVSVIVGGFLLGFFCSRAYRKWVVKGNIFDYIIFLLLCVGLMMFSLFVNKLESTPVWFSIILFYLFRKKFILKKSTINS